MSLLDAAESRACAALALAEEESRHNEALEKELAELRASRAELLRQPAFLLLPFKLPRESPSLCLRRDSRCVVATGRL